MRRKITRLLFMFLTISFFFISCHKDDLKPNDREINSAITQLKKLKNEDFLLMDYQAGKQKYTFHFEDEDLKVSTTIIQEVVDKKEEWETKIIFTDDSTFSIPTQGDSLDYIVKNVTLNPSAYNPLAAKIEVRFPVSGRAKIIIHGKQGSTSTISHTFKAYQAHQTLPVLGLYENYNNQVDIVFMNESGKERGRAHTSIKTKPLNINRLPTFRVGVKKSDKMEPGVNLVSYPGEAELDTSIPYMVDSDGEIRWILLLEDHPELKHFIDQRGLKRTTKGTYIAGDMSSNKIYEFDVLGNIINEWSLGALGYSFHHEVTEATNGNYLITVTKDDAKLKDGTPRIYDHIIELDPDAGNLVNEWDLANMLDISRYPQPDGVTPEEWAPSPGNWGQSNSIKERGDNLLATMRFQGIFSFTHSAKLKWIISPHGRWGESYQKYLLTPLDKGGHKITDKDVILGKRSGDDFDWPWGPHSPMAMPNGNILVFDNGYNRYFMNNTSNEKEDYSRVVEYKVDEKNMTVQQVWSYGENRGKETFSRALGGVQYLTETGNVLFCSGTQTHTKEGRGGHVIEIDPKTRKRVFELEITAPGGRAFHQVTRMKMYPENL